MQSKFAPGTRPLTSTAPRKQQPRRIAPAKLAAKFRVEVAKEKEAQHEKKRQTRSNAVIEHVEALVEAQRKKKAGPSALGPVMKVSTPIQETKGKVRKKNRLVRLLQLSVLAVMSHPFGAQLASWTTEVAVDCGAEWLREAVDIAVARGPHPMAIAPNAIVLVHKYIDYQVKARFTQVVCWAEIKDDLPTHFKVSPVAVTPQTGRQGRMIVLDPSFPVRRLPQKGTPHGRRDQRVRQLHHAKACSD